MDTAEAPTAPPHAPSSAVGPFPPSPRRRRRWLLAVLLVAIIAVVVGTITWSSHYDPFVGGSSTFRPSLTVDPEARDVSYGEGPVEVAYFISPVEGEPFRYAFSIRNDGLRAVTVISIGRTAAEQRGDTIARVVDAVELDPNGPDGTRIPATEAFELEPGAEVNVWMEATVRRCQRDVTTSWSSEPIEFRVFGLVTREVDFWPRTSIVVRPGRCRES